MPWNGEPWTSRAAWWEWSACDAHWLEKWQAGRLIYGLGDQTHVFIHQALTFSSYGNIVSHFFYMLARVSQKDASGEENRVSSHTATSEVSVSWLNFSESQLPLLQVVVITLGKFFFFFFLARFEKDNVLKTLADLFFLRQESSSLLTISSSLSPSYYFSL